jgi:hypothetical protein
MDLSIKIDFTIVPTKEPKEIVILDTSNWGVAYTQPSYLSVLPPGYSNYINLNFVKQTYTILNSTNLGMSCITQDCTEICLEDLDDGVWEFILKSSYSGLDKKRYFLKDDQLRREIDKVRISLFQNQGFNVPPDNIAVKELNKIEFLLSTAHSLIRQGMNSDAMKGYLESVKLLEKLKKCKNCI